MIQNGKKVKFHYQLMVSGETIDSSEASGPLEYEHGKGQIIPGLERALENHDVGDQCNVHIGPEDAYGIVNPSAVVDIPKDQIKGEDLEEGHIVAAQNEDGKTVRGVVKALHEDSVTVDFNHPLAGKELYFEIKIVEIM